MVRTKSYLLRSLNASVRNITIITRRPAGIRLFFRLLAVGLAGLHAWAAITSQSMNADGISYLDIGDAYFNADWQNAINPVWSPMYSWILGFANYLIKPGIEWQFPLVHIINFLIFLTTLVSFEYLWSSIQRVQERQGEPGLLQIPGYLWWALGYALFIWTTLSMIQIWAVTPDMLMATVILLCATLLVKIRASEGNSRTFLLLGLLLGLGYLTKSFMFSMAFVFLGLSFLVQNNWKKAFKNTALASIIFILISAPFILLISNGKGKLTIGEAGTVTFLRYVNGMPFPHWQGDPSRGMVPDHGSKLVFENPPVYAFGEPVGGTYPISTDPSYWYEGIQPNLDIKVLVKRLAANSLVYLELFFHQQGALTVAFLTLYLLGQSVKASLFHILQRWALVIPAIIAFGLYGLILVEDRYIGIFVLLFWVDILGNVRIRDAGDNQRWINALVSLALLGTCVNIGLFNLDGVKRLNMAESTITSSQTTRPPARPITVALALQEAGIQPGDKVGIIGYAYDSFWARLARVKIVSEMLEEDAQLLWQGDPDLQKKVFKAFAGTGAKAVVAEYVPEDATMNDWQQIGSSNYYYYIFSEK